MNQFEKSLPTFGTPKEKVWKETLADASIQCLPVGGRACKPQNLRPILIRLVSFRVLFDSKHCIALPLKAIAAESVGQRLIIKFDYGVWLNC